MSEVQLDKDTIGVYDYIVDYIRRYGYAPTIHEIAEANAASTWKVHKSLVLLQNSGDISRAKGKARSIHLLKYGLIKL